MSSRAVTTLLRYEMGNGFSAHGGLRFQTVKGLIQTTNRLQASSDVGVGYVVGAAYERPDIAMRVALTYSSKIKQSLSGTENATPVSLSVETPDSINLEFQTGVAANTLVFGSIRYAFWDGFTVATAANNYVTFTEDTITYSLGVGRKFNDNWSGALTLGFEEPGARPSTTALAPTTGQTTLGVGVTYTQGNTTVTGGVSYGILGDQTNPAATGGAVFNDNKVIGAGFRIGFNF